MKKVLAVILTIALCFTLASCSGKPASTDTNTPPAGSGGQAPAGEVIKMRMANQHPIDHMATIADQAAIDEIREKTDGRIEIQLYPASQLGDYIQTYEEVMRGTIDIAHITIPDKFDSRINITVCPFLATTYEELEKVYGPGSYLDSIIGGIQEESNVKLLGIFTEGLIGVGTKNPVANEKAPNQDKKSKIRVPSYEPIKLAVERMGFKTSTIPYTDTFTSIQTGIVDGWMGGPPSLNYMSFRDVIDNYYQYNIVTEVTEVVMNLDKFKGLSDEDKKIIEEAFDKQCRASITSIREEDEKYMDLMKKEGIHVVTFTQDEIDAISKDIRENVWPKTYDLFPKEMLDGVLADLKK